MTRSSELKLSGIKELMSTPIPESFSSKLLLKVCELAHGYVDLMTRIKH